MAEDEQLSDISFSSIHCQGTFRPPHLDVSEKNLREMRREIRHGYRKILEKTNEAASNDAPVDSRHITDDVEQANLLLEQVTQPREGSFDSTVIKQCTNLFKKRTTQMETRRKFDPDLYAKRFIAFTKNMNEQDVIVGGNDDNNDESAVTTELTKEELLKFSDFVAPVFNPAPAFHYLHGGFSRQPHEFVKVEKLKRNRSEVEKAGPSKPNVKIVDEDGTEDEITARRTEKLKRHLDEAFRQTNNGPVAYFDFVINPHDFSKTVENMFYFSFLVKDGRVNFGLDDKGIPIIEPFVATHGRRLQDMERNQCILTMDYEEWQEIVDAFDIEEPFFDLDE